MDNLDLIKSRIKEAEEKIQQELEDLQLLLFAYPLGIDSIGFSKIECIPGKKMPDKIIRTNIKVYI